MADAHAAAKDVKPAVEHAAKASEGNPVFRMMGLPNLKWKLPSRNWMIFLTIAGSWTAALVYDRQQKKRVQKKWCDAVAHLARETLPTSSMPRKATIYLAAPPADGLMSTREHFHEYVKPILVAAAMDWDAVEGRREGDVRAGLAERIRKARKMHGEATAEPLEEDTETAVWQMREKAGVKEWEGPQGDIVIGRNTWKEYVRGLHEGWLGPLDPPPEPAKEELPAPPSDSSAPTPSSSTEDASPTAQPASPDPASPEPATAPEEQKPASEQEQSKPAKRKQPPPFVSPAEYASATLSPNCPAELPPSTTIPFPYILGFLNTPIRMYRFLTRRHLADEIGQQVAAVVLAAYRPYEGPEQADINAFERIEPVGEEGGEKWEQQRLLKGEEKEWHKSVRKDAENKRLEGKESVWCDEIVLDPRIGGRMRRFVLEEEQRVRAQRIAEGKEGVFDAAERDGDGELR